LTTQWITVLTKLGLDDTITLLPVLSLHGNKTKKSIKKGRKKTTSID